MMLYPDMTRSAYEGSDTFVFAAPCTEGEWFELMQGGGLMNRACNEVYLRWVMVKDDSDERIVVIMQAPHDTDEIAETTAAWIRVSEEFRGMIYALKYDPAYGSSQTLAQIICRTAGVPPSQVRHVIITKRNLV